MEQLFEFLKHTVASESECLEWVGAKRAKYYGGFHYQLAHRWIYEKIVEPLKPELVVDHLCGNKKCVNPWHLQQITDVENRRRGYDLYLDNLTHCINGHERTEENTYIYPSTGYGQCRECQREYQKQRWRKKKKAKLG